MARSNLVTKRAPSSGDAKQGPPKSITTLAEEEKSVLDFVFHTRFVRRVRRENKGERFRKIPMRILPMRLDETVLVSNSFGCGSGSSRLFGGVSVHGLYGDNGAPFVKAARISSIARATSCGLSA